MRDFNIEIPDSNPFKNDKFNRKLIAENLTNIISNQNDGIVMSIDSSWGTGKTTFINMWKSMLDNDERYAEQYETLYFNAWKNDYLMDPLVALFAEIDLKTNSDSNGVFDYIKKNRKKLIKPLFTTAIKIATMGALDLKQINLGADVENELCSLSGECTEALLLDTIENKKNRNIFIEELAKFQEKSGRKVIFFIDELDRCRPTFAIELLETVKHIFDLKDFIFIISLDKRQLSHAVKLVYGKEVDTIGYLRRFFDFDFELPKVDINTYITFKNGELRSKYEFEEKLGYYLRGFILNSKLSLRDIDKLYYYTQILLSSGIECVKIDSYGSEVSCFLYAYFSYLKISDNEAFDCFIKGNYEYSDAKIHDIFKLNEIKSYSGKDFSLSDELLRNSMVPAINKYLLLEKNNNYKETYEVNINGHQYDLRGLFRNQDERISNKMQFASRFNID